MKNSMIKTMIRFFVFISVVASISLTNIAPAAAGTSNTPPAGGEPIIVVRPNGRPPIIIIRPDVSWNS
ncbi:MAG: hypothetical protein KIH69_010715 [Anaerolineae bacterium]|nr:hypothetical protein [Anaerolineae bacterium]